MSRLSSVREGGKYLVDRGDFVNWWEHQILDETLCRTMAVI